MIFSAMQLSTLPPLSAICLAHDITLWPKCKRQKGQKWRRPAATETPDVTGIRELQDSVAYIDWKQNFYDEVLSGKRPYESNLIRVEK